MNSLDSNNIFNSTIRQICAFIDRNKENPKPQKPKSEKPRSDAERQALREALKNGDKQP